MIDRVPKTCLIKQVVKLTNSAATIKKKCKAAAGGTPKSGRTRHGSSGDGGASASAIVTDMRVWGTPRTQCHDWWRGLACAKPNRHREHSDDTRGRTMSGQASPRAMQQPRRPRQARPPHPSARAAARASVPAPAFFIPVAASKDMACPARGARVDPDGGGRVHS